jgi:exosortase
MTVNYESGAGSAVATRYAPASLLILCLVLFPTWLTFPSTWSEGRSHGFAVAVYCLWLVWQARGQLRVSSDLTISGRLVAVTGGLCWLLSMVIGVRLFHQTFAVAILLAWAVSVYGRTALDRLSPAAAIFTLALPVWELLLDLLQGMTVAVNHALVRMASIPATLDGTRIHFPFGTIEVAQSCAGLSYFMSAFTISVIYSHLFLRYLRARAAAVLLAIVLALISNWVRVFGLVVIGYRSRMQSPLMEEHAFYGWVIFAVAISGFFLLAGRIERWECTVLLADSHSTIERAEPDNRNAVTSPSTNGVRALAMSTVTAVVVPVGYLLVKSAAGPLVMPTTTPGVTVPANWSAHAIVTTAGRAADSVQGLWLPDLRGEHHRVAFSIAPSGESVLPTVQLVRFGYDGNSQGSELIGGSNAITATDRLVSDRTVGPLDKNLRMVRQAVVRDRSSARLVWYWYRVAGMSTPSPTRAKLLEVVAFVRRHEPSELVAVSAPCAPNNCQQALAALHLVVIGRELPPRGNGTTGS